MFLWARICRNGTQVSATYNVGGVTTLELTTNLADGSIGPQIPKKFVYFTVFLQGNCQESGKVPGFNGKWNQITEIHRGCLKHMATSEKSAARLLLRGEPSSEAGDAFSPSDASNAVSFREQDLSS